MYIESVRYTLVECHGDMLGVVRGDCALAVLGVADRVTCTGNPYENPPMDVSVRADFTEKIQAVNAYRLALGVLSLQLLPFNQGACCRRLHFRRHFPTAGSPPLHGADSNLYRLGLVMPVSLQRMGDVLDIGGELSRLVAPQAVGSQWLVHGGEFSCLSGF